jgi:hypothetical protein
MERIIFPFRKGENSILAGRSSHSFLIPAALNHKNSRNRALQGAFAKIFFILVREDLPRWNRKE